MFIFVFEMGSRTFAAICRFAVALRPLWELEKSFSEPTSPMNIKDTALFVYFRDAMVLFAATFIYVSLPYLFGSG